MTAAPDLRDFIVERFLFGEADQLTDETPLVESGIVDSTGILDIIGFIETNYPVTVSDEDVIPLNFATLAAMSIYLGQKMPSSQPVSTPPIQ